MKHEESKLQIELVKLFRTKIENRGQKGDKSGLVFEQLNRRYRVLNGNCFIMSTRNEERSSIQGAVRLKQLGMKEGVSDLIVMVGDKVGDERIGGAIRYNGIRCIFIELKTQDEKEKKGEGLRDTQKKFRDMVREYAGGVSGIYNVVDRPSEFLKVLEEYGIIEEVKG